jgi:probable rRNA maturation factor
MDDDDHPARDLPRILISNRQGAPIDEGSIREVARRTLRAEGLERTELSVSFVEPGEIAGLHERFMDEPGPTDVLSFPQDDAVDDGVRLLGDVVVAPDEAARNNPDDPAGELRLLVVHGILHLLGYDHQKDDARTRMWERQERYSGVAGP